MQIDAPLAPRDPAARTYSTLEVARRLGVSVQTVQRWVDAGRLRAWVTPGGHRRIDAAGAEQMLAERAGSIGAAAAPAVAPSRPVSVLIVDDSKADRDLAALLVRGAVPAAAVTEAESGFEALLALGSRPVDLLVADLVMPHMNGFEMLRHLAADPGHRPRLIIATSSLKPDELGTVGVLPPDVAFMPKPLDGGALADWLRRHLGA